MDGQTDDKRQSTYTNFFYIVVSSLQIQNILFEKISSKN